VQTWLQKRRKKKRKKEKKKKRKKEKEKFFRTVIVCALEAFEVKQHEVIKRKHHKLKMMPNHNRPVFPNRRRLAGSPSRHHPNHRVLVTFPRTYFEVEDIRPGEDELSEYVQDFRIDRWQTNNSKRTESEDFAIFAGKGFT